MLRFTDFQELIGANVVQYLPGAGRPKDLDDGFFGGAQAKVQALVVCGKVAACRRGKASLAIHSDAGAVTVAVAACSAQSYR